MITLHTDIITRLCPNFDADLPQLCFYKPRELRDSDSKVHGANMGPTEPRWAPCWPH